jgi:hypothetical protein
MKMRRENGETGIATLFRSVGVLGDRDHYVVHTFVWRGCNRAKRRRQIRLLHTNACTRNPYLMFLSTNVTDSMGTWLPRQCICAWRSALSSICISSRLVGVAMTNFIFCDVIWAPCLCFWARIHPGRCINHIEGRLRWPIQRQEWLQLNTTPGDTRLTTPTHGTQLWRPALYRHPPRMARGEAQSLRTASRPKMEIMGANTTPEANGSTYCKLISA